MDTLAPDRDPALTDFADTSEVADRERGLAALYGVRRLERMEAALENRVTTLEAQMEHAHAVLFPEADFDSGVFTIPAGGGMVVEHGLAKVSQLECVRVTDDGLEELLPWTAADGKKVFATRPEPWGCRVYNTTSSPKRVRVRAYSG